MVTLASKLCYNYVVVTLYLSKNSRFIIHSRRFFEAVTVISGRRVSKFLRFYVIDNKPFFAIKSEAVFFGRLLGAQGQIADQIPDAPFAGLIAGAAHRYPKPARRALTVFHSPEAAPPRVAFEPERIEFGPRSTIDHFDAAFDANDVLDLQTVK